MLLLRRNLYSLVVDLLLLLLTFGVCTTAFVHRLSDCSINKVSYNQHKNNKSKEICSTKSFTFLNQKQIVHPQQQRFSIGTSKLYGGLFGLGPLEIGIILIGVGIVIGPKGIATVAKTTASRTVDLANEMKNIPSEFQQGVEIGEIEARSKKAKRIVVKKQQQGDNDDDDNNNTNNSTA
jgi:Sec-independent protein translocase protein TatA